MAKSINLTSQEWRDIVFEGKNKEFGAYDMRKKSPKRHVWSIVGVIVFAALLIGGLVWYSAYQAQKEKEEREARLKQLQMQEQMAQMQAEEEQKEEEEEEEVKYEEPEEEIVEEAVAAQMVTTIDITDVVEKEREVKTVDEVQSNEAQIGAVNQEGKIDISQVNDAVKEVTVAPVAPKVEPVKKAEPEQIFTAVEEQAAFPGGQDALMKWLQQNVRYPELAQQNNVQGKVTVKFTVEKDGSITDPVIVKGVDKELDKEAIRVVKKMPKWKPGKNNGQAVRSYFFLPVNFQLQ